MKKYLRIFVIIFAALSFLATAEICQAQEYYYAPPATSYSVSTAEVIMGVLVVGAIVGAVALLAGHHHHDDYPPPPPKPYLHFTSWSIPRVPLYYGEVQDLEYTIENMRDEGTSITVYTPDDSMIRRSPAIAFDCADYLPAYSSCNIKLVVHATEIRPINTALEVDDDAGFTISSPIITYVIYPNGANKDLTVTTPHISNMTINKDKSQTLDYVLTNHTNKALDISKISGFTSPVTRDNNIENNCGNSLAADGSCRLRLNVNPTQPGNIAQQLIVGNGTTNYFIAPINLAVHPVAVVYKDSTPVLYALPQQKYNDGKITLKNYYTKPVKTDAFMRPVNGVDMKFTATTCGETLAPNASCEYQFQYQAADSNKLKLGTSDRPFVTGVNSVITIKYKVDNNNSYLQFPLQTFLPSDKRILNMPLNTTAYNSMPSTNITQKIKIGDVVYAATADKGLAISKDDGISWKTYTIGNGLGSDHINAVTASKDGRNLYVATDNGLAISSDFGATWKNYNKLSSLGSDKITAITVSLDGATITATTADHGMVTSSNGGETWK